MTRKKPRKTRQTTLQSDKFLVKSVQKTHTLSRRDLAQLLIETTKAQKNKTRDGLAGELGRKLSPDLRGILTGLDIAGKSPKLEKRTIEIIKRKKSKTRPQRSLLRQRGEFGAELVFEGDPEDLIVPNIKKIRIQARDKERDTKKIKRSDLSKKKKKLLRKTKVEFRIEARFKCKVPEEYHDSKQNMLFHTMFIPTNAKTDGGVRGVVIRIHNKVFKHHAIITIESIEVKS